MYKTKEQTRVVRVSIIDDKEGKVTGNLVCNKPLPISVFTALASILHTNFFFFKNEIENVEGNGVQY